jgi:hypothetical protein
VIVMLHTPTWTYSTQLLSTCRKISVSRSKVDKLVEQGTSILACTQTRKECGAVDIDTGVLISTPILISIPQP